MFKYCLIAFVFFVDLFPGEVEGSKMSLLNILDETGKNLCIGELRCYLRTDQTVSVTSDLTLEEKAAGWKFHIILEKALVGTKLVEKDLNLCWEEKTSRVVLSEDACEHDTVPASTVPYSMAIELHVPFFKDMAFLSISGPDDVESRRMLVSSHSSRPPIKIPDCSLGPC